MLNAQLPARRRAVVALVALAASAAFGVADAGAADPNGTGTTNLGCRYALRPPSSIPVRYRRQALMCALNRARLVNHAAPLRMEPTLTRAAQLYTARSVSLKWWDRSNPLVSHVDPQTGSVALQRDQASGFCRTGTNPAVAELTYSSGAGAAGSPTAAVNAWLTDGTQRLVLLRPPGLYAGPGMAPGSAYNPPDPDPSGTFVVDLGGCTR